MKKDQDITIGEVDQNVQAKVRRAKEIIEAAITTANHEEATSTKSQNFNSHTNDCTIWAEKDKKTNKVLYVLRNPIRTDGVFLKFIEVIDIAGLEQIKQSDIDKIIRIQFDTNNAISKYSWLPTSLKALRSNKNLYWDIERFVNTIKCIRNEKLHSLINNLSQKSLIVESKQSVDLTDLIDNINRIESLDQEEYKGLIDTISSILPNNDDKVYTYTSIDSNNNKVLISCNTKTLKALIQTSCKKKIPKNNAIETKANYVEMGNTQEKTPEVKQSVIPIETEPKLKIEEVPPEEPILLEIEPKPTEEAPSVELTNPIQSTNHSITPIQMLAIASEPYSQTGTVQQGSVNGESVDNNGNGSNDIVADTHDADNLYKYTIHEDKKNIEFKDFTLSDIIAAVAGGGTGVMLFKIFNIHFPQYISQSTTHQQAGYCTTGFIFSALSCLLSVIFRKLSIQRDASNSGELTLEVEQITDGEINGIENTAINNNQISIA